ncbi:MAG: glycosyltransferase [Verrucomicrobiae bacterium]|nr:glycosyltransferase [Verrucomicrobiae bacterium]
MELPLITFILFAYNQAHYVREAIEAALAQSYSPLEIILSDDCSQDKTFEIMKSMAASYKGPHRIILNRNEVNRGVGAHVNKAFSLSSGRWIVTAAGDDVSDPGRCARVAELASLHPDAAAIGLGWRDIDASGAPVSGRMLQRYLDARHISGMDPGWIRAYRSGDFGVWGMTAAWRSDLIQGWPTLPDDCRQEDEIYSFRAALAGHSMILDPGVYASYRHHDSNASGFDRRTDPDTTERRRTARALMNLKTWQTLHDELATLPNLPPGLPSETMRNELLLILRRKIAKEHNESTWWESGILTRITRSFFPPERERPISWPREWSRMLPRQWHLALETRRQSVAMEK